MAGRFRHWVQVFGAGRWSGGRCGYRSPVTSATPDAAESRSAIRAVLLDVGDTLTTPKGGRWNPRFDVEDTLARAGLSWAPDRWPVAVAAADAYLHRAPAQATRDDYHRVLLAELGIEATAPLLEALDAPRPFRDIVDVFPDVEPALVELRSRGLRLGIVSDTGPEARRLYEELGWTRFFEAYAISGELGCCKPDPRMYRTASDALGLSPAECLFVDNDLGCLRGAAVLGYPVCGISRYGPPPAGSDDGHDGDAGGFPWVSDLTGVLRLVDANDP